MFKWLKKLFKKRGEVVSSLDLEGELKPIVRYNIRDEKGRFVKKGNKNGKRR